MIAMIVCQAHHPTLDPHFALIAPYKHILRIMHHPLVTTVLLVSSPTLKGPHAQNAQQEHLVMIMAPNVFHVNLDTFLTNPRPPMSLLVTPVLQEK